MRLLLNRWCARQIGVITCLLALALLGGMSPPAYALDPTDKIQIRKIIEDQIDAFRKDDAPRAFSHASPLVQERLQSPDLFIRMVREGYAVVYRPNSVRFLRSEDVPDQSVYQYVQMSDQEGQVWVARYRMLKTARGQWKIDGCEVQRTDGVMT